MHTERITPSRTSRCVPAALAVRGRGLLVALPCWAVLLTAWSLTPRPAGFGTAEQLGLPACSWMTEKGIPCPTCGLTTSLAAAAQADFVAAARAHAFGVVLFFGLVALALTGTGQALTGRNWLARIRFRLWWVVVAVVGLLGGWTVNLAAGYAAGQYPTH
ncbi:MAG: DUF2752 domain-containing protein [Phycisphaerae bacterium]|nr:DUF2752 domain-containing protein [Phycisphaerae bacterium]